MWSDEARAASILARQSSAKANANGGIDNGTHAAGVNNVGKGLVADKVLDVIRGSPQGASVTLNGETPTKGYMVAQHGRTQFVDTKDLTGPAARGILNDYAARNRDVLMKAGAHIGIWNDPKSGKTHLDVADNISRARAAVGRGKKQNQISIWDVKRQRTINTGGKGD